jgi:hypothetical protein
MERWDIVSRHSKISTLLKKTAAENHTAVRVAVAPRANTRNPSAYLGRNRVRRDGVEKGEKHPEWRRELIYDF